MGDPQLTANISFRAMGQQTWSNQRPKIFYQVKVACSIPLPMNVATLDLDMLVI
jgi:hypothetical protein